MSYYFDCLRNTFKSPFGNPAIAILVPTSTLQKFNFSSQNFFEKIKCFWPIQLVRSFIWHQYHFLQELISPRSSFHPSRGIHWYCTKKWCLNFCSTHPLAFWKNSFDENFGKLSSKIIGLLNAGTFAYLLGLRKNTRLERFMSVVDVQKKAWQKGLGLCRGLCVQSHVSYDKALYWIRDICVAQWDMKNK